MNAWQALGATGILILSTLILLPVTIMLNERLDLERSMLVNYLITMLVAFSANIYIWKVRFIAGEFAVTHHELRIIPLIIVVTLALMTGVVSPLSHLIPLSDSFRELILKLGEHKGIYAFMMMVVAAPLLEELLFRGIILKGLLNRYKPGTAIVISSILFGVAHLNPWQFVAAFVLGIFMGWIYYHTSNLVLVIVIHMVANLTGFAFRFFIDVKTMIDVHIVDFYGGWLNFTLIVAGCLLLIAASVYWIRIQFLAVVPSPLALDTQPEEKDGPFV